jgi:transcription elongation factor Elf1
MALFDLDFEYQCPHCGEHFLGEHDIEKETCVKIVTCDECGKKYKLTSKAVINIEVDVEKA